MQSRTKKKQVDITKYMVYIIYVLFRYKPVKHYSSDSSNFSYGGWNDLCTCNWRN